MSSDVCIAGDWQGPQPAILDLPMSFGCQETISKNSFKSEQVIWHRQRVLPWMTPCHPETPSLVWLLGQIWKFSLSFRKIKCSALPALPQGRLLWLLPLWTPAGKECPVKRPLSSCREVWTLTKPSYLFCRTVYTLNGNVCFLCPTLRL